MKIFIRLKKGQLSSDQRNQLVESLFKCTLDHIKDLKYKLISVDKLGSETRIFDPLSYCEEFKGETLAKGRALTREFQEFLIRKEIHQFIFTKKNIKSRLPKFDLTVNSVKKNLYELKLLNEHKGLARSIFWSNENETELCKFNAFIKDELKSVAYSKNALRSKVKFYKDQFTENERQIESTKILTKLKESKEYQNAELVFIYWSMNDEVDTINFIKEEHNRGKEFILPVIDGEDLILKRYSGTKNLQDGDLFGIPEPVGEVFNDYAKIDLAVIPGVAFNFKGDRLGRGKGYYDKILDDLSAKTKLIGLCFDFQIFDYIPVEVHDKKLNLVLTNN